MSFWPLAKTLTDALHGASRSGPVVEVGCGEGEFLHRLSVAGVEAVGLDQDPSALECLRRTQPDRASVLARAQKLPFSDESVSAILFANLIRNCVGDWDQIADSARRALRPGGILVVLEDDAEDGDEAARNYRETLRLLSAVDATRGPALSAIHLEALCDSQFGRAIHAGSAENELPILDAELPLRWLRARRLETEQQHALAELTRNVRYHGMRYGRYLYRVYRLDQSCAA